MLNPGHTIRLFLIPLFYLVATTLVSAQKVPEFFITGTVNDESGRVIAQVRVCAVPDDYDRVRMAPCALTDSAGQFVIKTPRAGRYKLFPEKSASGYYFQRSPFFRHPSIAITEIVVSEEMKTAKVSIFLPPKNGALVGRALDASTNRPIENMRVILCHAADPKICWSTSVKNAGGEFSLPAAYVPFTLRIIADGYQDWYGLSGTDKAEPITVGSGTSLQLAVYLKRRPETANRPLNETEKQPGVNLPAPVMSAPADGIELSNYPRATKLEWQPVEGAVSYTVEIDYCDGRVKGQRECINPQPWVWSKNPPRNVLGTTYEFDFVGAQPGRWRVWAVDKAGQEGFKSPWRTFFYLK